MSETTGTEACEACGGTPVPGMHCPECGQFGSTVEARRRRHVTNTAPVGSVDLAAFDENGDAYEITACHECLPWHAEVIVDEDSRTIYVREWHAVECSVFEDLIVRERECSECEDSPAPGTVCGFCGRYDPNVDGN